MTWLGYAIILTDEQKIWALIVAVIFALFARICGRGMLLTMAVFPVIYLMAIAYAINENAMYQIKAEFCVKHHEIADCTQWTSPYGTNDSHK